MLYRTTYNYASLSKHHVSLIEVDELATAGNTIECEMPPSNRGNERLMLIGFTNNGRLLEIGIEFFYDEDRMHIFHGNDCNKHYEQEYRRRIKP